MRGYGSLIATAIVTTWLLSPNFVSAQQASTSDVSPSIDVEVDTEEKALTTRIRKREEVSARTLVVLEGGSEVQAAPTSTVVQGEEPNTIQPLEKGQKTNAAAAAVSPDQSPSEAQPRIARANCGPILLQRVFEKYGRQTTLEKLVEQSNTRYGLTSLYGMRQTVIEQEGLYAEGIKTDFATLVDLIQKYDVICHFSKNNHYIWLQSIEGPRVNFVDPTWIAFDDGSQRMSRSIFEDIWQGICLVISDRPLTELAIKSKGRHGGEQ